jgi:dipeptidyl aminopeptidase/acylaminoacyl peptidase
MTSDPLVTSAIAHWGPRFVANGVALTDFEEVTASVGAWDEWCAAWSARAGVHEAMGREALARNRHLSAGEHLQRAAVYYHFAKFVFVQDVRQMKAAHMKAVECRNLALPHIGPPGERVAIPYEGKSLYGILRKPQGSAKNGATRPPVMIMAVGLDSAKEETEAYERPFLERGIAVLVFDGPGQGEGEYDFPIRGDYEVAVKAVADYIETRDDLDSSRIGLWGVSLGGYYAPRAAAFEKRIKACIALGGPFDVAEAWQGLPQLTRETFRVRSHCATEADAKRNAATLSLKAVAGQITCPLFVMTGKQDRLIPWRDAERLASAAKGPVELLIVEDGNHVANNRGYRWRLQSADWMAERLGVSPA